MPIKKIKGVFITWRRKMSKKLLFVFTMLVIGVVSLPGGIQVTMPYPSEDSDSWKYNHGASHMNSIIRLSPDGDEGCLSVHWYSLKEGIEGESYHEDQDEIGGNKNIGAGIEPDVPFPTSIPTPTPESRCGNNREGLYGGAYLSGTIVKADFQNGTDGFVYLDDTFETNNPDKASGTYEADNGFAGGGLRVLLGPGRTAGPTSGGWQYTFNVDAGVITIGMRYRIIMGKGYESNEYGNVIVNMSGMQTIVAKVVGDGNDGIADDSGWKYVSFDLIVTSGVHTMTIGAYNNNSSYPDEWVELLIDDVEVKKSGTTPSPTCLPTRSPTSVPTIPPTGKPTSIITPAPTP
jgi:hypothetical protein